MYSHARHVFKASSSKDQKISQNTEYNPKLQNDYYCQITVNSYTQPQSILAYLYLNSTH